ncbi:MAG: DUF4190 domain-containing protein [Microbacterium sp.]
MSTSTPDGSTPDVPPPVSTPSAYPAAPAQPAYPAPSPGYSAPPPYGAAAPYPQAGYGGYPTAPKTNTLAIVSLVSSIAGITVIPFIGSIVGVITGHMSLSQIKRNGEGGRGLALGGTIVGWVGLALSVVAVIAMLAFIGMLATSGALT